MSSRAPDPDPARLANIVGAWALAVADRMNEAAVSAAGRGGQAPAALNALHEFSNGRPIEQLRSILGLSHSATVRLVDALEGDGLVARDASADDRRSVAVTLTTAGRRRADRIARARHDAIVDTLAPLRDCDRRTLQELIQELVGGVVAVRLRERETGSIPPRGWLCRLCDFGACGRDDGRCPAAAPMTSGGR